MMSGLAQFLQDWIGALVSVIGAGLLFIAGWLRSYTSAVDKRQTAARHEAMASLKQRIEDTEERMNRLRDAQSRHETYVASNHPTRPEIREMLAELKDHIKQGDENIMRHISQLADRMNRHNGTG